MSNPDSPDPSDEKFYPGYTQMKEEWRESGCLPPDEAEEKLQKLADDVKNGRIDERDRNRIAINAENIWRAGGISDGMRKKLLEALKVDDNGNLQNLG